MVGYDLPHIAHDMILRFMGVDFSIIGHNGGPGSSAQIPSSVGGDVKPVIDAVPADGNEIPDKGKEASPSTPEVDNTALWQSTPSPFPL